MRFTKLEREALSYVVNEVLAGDPQEYFNNGCAVPESGRTPEQKRAVRLAEALVRIHEKLGE